MGMGGSSGEEDYSVLRLKRMLGNIGIIASAVYLSGVMIASGIINRKDVEIQRPRR